MRRHWWKLEALVDKGYWGFPVQVPPFRATEEEAQDVLLEVAMFLTRFYSDWLGYGAMGGLGTLTRIQVVGGPSSNRIVFSFVLTLRKISRAEALSLVESSSSSPEVE